LVSTEWSEGLGRLTPLARFIVREGDHEAGGLRFIAVLPALDEVTIHRLGSPRFPSFRPGLRGEQARVSPQLFTGRAWLFRERVKREGRLFIFRAYTLNLNTSALISGAP
jgi:hypothetical protein